MNVLYKLSTPVRSQESQILTIYTLCFKKQKLRYKPCLQNIFDVVKNDTKVHHYKKYFIFIGCRKCKYFDKGRLRTKKKYGTNFNLLFKDKILLIHKNVLTKFMYNLIAHRLIYFLFCIFVNP
jgi:hypothetical protein